MHDVLWFCAVVGLPFGVYICEVTLVVSVAVVWVFGLNGWCLYDYCLWIGSWLRLLVGLLPECVINSVGFLDSLLMLCVWLFVFF